MKKIIINIIGEKDELLATNECLTWEDAYENLGKLERHLGKDEEIDEFPTDDQLDEKLEEF